MTDKANPAVSIMLDKERHLLLTFRAMRAFKEATGNDLETMGKTITLDDMEALLWACLLHEDRDLKLEDVGHMIHNKNMEYVVDTLMEALEMAKPEGGKDDVPLARKHRSKRQRG